jgi:protein-S-isoprenylcysteine O-methyltransferase Ste14
VSRFFVTAVFVLLSVATGAAALQAAGEALTEPTARAWAVAGYSQLKLAVVIAFSIFVFTREPAKRRSRDPVAFVACAVAVAAVVVLQPPPESAATWLVVAGETVTLGSCVWLLAAVVALGRCFGVLPEARGLVTTGPYRFVRHPVYLGELGAAAGLVLAAPTPWNVGVVVAFLAAQAVRMRLEEQALAAEFPEYAAYAAQTPRLVPRLRLHRQPRPATGDAR